LSSGWDKTTESEQRFASCDFLASLSHFSRCKGFWDGPFGKSDEKFRIEYMDGITGLLRCTIPIWSVPWYTQKMLAWLSLRLTLISVYHVTHDISYM